MTTFTPSVSGATLIRNGVVQGFGLGFLFTPLSTVTFATLPPHLRTQATSLFSLMRNLGSSIGVSVVIFMLERNTQAMHAQLAQFATPQNPALHMPGVSQIWNLATLAGRAALDMEINRQAAIVAYVDDYRLMAIMAIVAAPLVILLRSHRARPDPAQAMAVE